MAFFGIDAEGNALTTGGNNITVPASAVSTGTGIIFTNDTNRAVICTLANCTLQASQSGNHNVHSNGEITVQAGSFIVMNVVSGTAAAGLASASVIHGTSGTEGVGYISVT